MTATLLRILIVCLVPAAAGCSAVGDFCHDDDDCGRGLRCNASPGARGICTYPEGLDDLTVTSDATDGPLAGDQVVDRATPDQAVPDLTDAAQPDGKSDITPPDQGAPDQVAPDHKVVDQSTTDQTKPDQAAPDQAAPDQAAPDGGPG